MYEDKFFLLLSEVSEIKPNSGGFLRTEFPFTIQWEFLLRAVLQSQS